MELFKLYFHHLPLYFPHFETTARQYEYESTILFSTSKVMTGNPGHPGLGLA
jgi:hypothetical protein